jgi:hypothetical protein
MHLLSFVLNCPLCLFFSPAPMHFLLFAMIILFVSFSLTLKCTYCHLLSIFLFVSFFSNAVIVICYLYFSLCLLLCLPYVFIVICTEFLPFLFFPSPLHLFSFTLILTLIHPIHFFFQLASLFVILLFSVYIIMVFI